MNDCITRDPDMDVAGRIAYQMACPQCGDRCIDRLGGDDASVTVTPDRDACDSPIGTRGGFVLIRMFCPAGHGFDLVIANHKGCEYLGVVMVGERTYECDPDSEPYVPDPA